MDTLPQASLKGWLQQNLNFLFGCPSVSSYVHVKINMLEILHSFQNIVAKIGGPIFTHLSNRLSVGSFDIFVDTNVQWLSCRPLVLFYLCVCQLVYLLIEKLKGWIFC